MAPPGAVLRLIAETDIGQRRVQAPPAGIQKREVTLELAGATRLESVTIEIDAADDGIAKGWFNWLGLQHSGRLARKLQAEAETTRDQRWEQHLKDTTFVPSFTPSYGLMLNAEELTALRRRHAALCAAGATSPFVTAAEAAQVRAPESMIHDFVNFWDDSRYNRERDHGKFILNHGLNAAIAGHLLHKKELLRLAARYALSIASCGRWDDGFTCHFPGSTFNHVCFVQCLCAYEVAGILDLAGEYFTDLGRDFLLRRLAEESIGSITYNTWSRHHIFGCNQLAWFTPARMLTLGILSRHSPRVRPYLDIAYSELCDSLDATILPDGGYPEGPMYFRCIGRDAGLGVYYYSRAIGRPMAELIPAAMRRCGDFGELVVSTDDTQDTIPFCDARPAHEILSQAIMAELLPDSAWPPMLRKCMALHGGWPVNPLYEEDGYPDMMADPAIAWGIAERLPTVLAEARPFVILPEMGPLSSLRVFQGHQVKLLIQGNRAGAGHAHEDKGSFVLECAGETFAMDLGTCTYGNPLAGLLQQCERHNMLVPYGCDERPAPSLHLPHDVKPTGRGDATSFHAEIDASPGWEPFYRRWQRTWDSPNPGILTITDAYALAKGTGVEFFWQTALPVQVEGHRAVIQGKRIRVVLEAPTGCVWRVDDLPLVGRVQHRLAFRHAGLSGSFAVVAHLSAC